MRHFLLILCVAIFQFNMSFIMGQSDSSSLIKPFGLGLHFDQFNSIDIGNKSIGSSNKIVVSISPSKGFRFEPEVGFKFNNDEKNNAAYYGLGLFSMSQLNRLNMYYGIRLEFAKIIWQESTTNYNNGSSYISTIDNKVERYSIGPVVGSEYYLGENFTIGGEFAFIYSVVDILNETKPDDTSMKSNLGLFMRFYF